MPLADLQLGHPAISAHTQWLAVVATTSVLQPGTSDSPYPSEGCVVNFRRPEYVWLPMRHPGLLAHSNVMARVAGITWIRRPCRSRGASRTTGSQFRRDTDVNVKKNRMLKRKIRNVAVTGITIVAATLIALSATGASAATTTTVTRVIPPPLPRFLLAPRHSISTTPMQPW